MFVAQHPFKFLPMFSPVAAVDVLQQHKAERVFSTAPFGGYMVSRDMKVFIDGRAELYGEHSCSTITMRVDAAMSASCWGCSTSTGSTPRC